MISIFKKSRLPILGLIGYRRSFYENGFYEISRDFKNNELDHFIYEKKLPKRILKYFNIVRSNKKPFQNQRSNLDIVFLIQGIKIDFNMLIRVLNLLSKPYKKDYGNCFRLSDELQLFNINLKQLQSISFRKKMGSEGC